MRHMSDLFVAGSQLEVPLVAIFLRKAYGLGAMAMAGGSFVEPVYAAAWPNGEFGGMGLEGAVRLGFRKELEAESDPEKKEALFDSLLAKLVRQGPRHRSRHAPRNRRGDRSRRHAATRQPRFGRSR